MGGGGPPPPPLARRAAARTPAGPGLWFAESGSLTGARPGPVGSRLSASCLFQPVCFIWGFPVSGLCQ